MTRSSPNRPVLRLLRRGEDPARPDPSGPQALASVTGVALATALVPGAPEAAPEAGRDPWTRDALAGRLVEIASHEPGPSATLAADLVRSSQLEQQPVAWVLARHDGLLPEDLEAAGIDLAALAVVRAPDARAAGRATTHLIRSGAFGLVVVDLPPGARWAEALAARLARTAAHQGAALVALTDKAPDAPSLSPLVSLRVHPERRRRGDGTWWCGFVAAKDKRRAPGWRHGRVCDAPPGLR